VADPSFDIVSKVEHQEVDNALNQAAKEITTRYDFKDTGSSIAWSGEKVEIKSNSEQRVKAVLEVFQEKLVKRGIPLKALQHGEPQPAGGNTAKLTVEIQQGIADDKAKAIAKKIRSEGPKGVQAQIQGDQLRVTGKKKDDLQAVIALLKDSDFEVPLQFTNYR
jgi:uncharacterized protein YajQ (UPF0234 family)